MVAVEVSPGTARIGYSVEVVIRIANPGAFAAAALVDFEVSFARPGGAVGRKVFKGMELALDPGASAVVRRRVSLRQMSTRRVHAFRPHAVVALLNGDRQAQVSFDVVG